MIHIHFGELDSTTNEHLKWFRADLRAGDEIMVRVLPPGEYDTPIDRHRGQAGG